MWLNVSFLGKRQSNISDDLEDEEEEDETVNNDDEDEISDLADPDDEGIVICFKHLIVVGFN